MAPVVGIAEVLSESEGIAAEVNRIVAAAADTVDRTVVVAEDMGRAVEADSRIVVVAADKTAADTAREESLASATLAAAVRKCRQRVLAGTR